MSKGDGDFYKALMKRYDRVYNPKANEITTREKEEREKARREANQDQRPQP